MKYYQQGDVLIKPASIPKSAQKQKSLILVEGEATGHNHAIIKGNAQAYRQGQNLWLAVLTTSFLEHPEHNPIELPPGEYQVCIVREYDHFAEEARRVVD